MPNVLPLFLTLLGKRTAQAFILALLRAIARRTDNTVDDEVIAAVEAALCNKPSPLWRVLR